jgi:hypothetical protein
MMSLTDNADCLLGALFAGGLTAKGAGANQKFPPSTHNYHKQWIMRFHLD